MKRTVENPDGIYPTIRHTAETREDVEAICAMWQAATPSVAEIIDGIEKSARAVLDSKPAAVMQADAIHVVTQCKALRQSIASGNVEATAYHGIALGQRYAELLVRRHEPSVRLGRGQQRRGREHAATVAAKRRQRREKIRSCVEEHIRKRGRHKTPSDTAIYKRTAMAFGVSIPTVRRACGKK